MAKAQASDTIAALCAAIDAGDDGALPILADALEGAGDPRAAGLRRIMAFGRLLAPRRLGGNVSAEHRWHWREMLGEPILPHDLRRDHWQGAWCAGLHAANDYFAVTGRRRENRLYYPTRIAAYLALAAAMSD